MPKVLLLSAGFLNINQISHGIEQQLLTSKDFKGNELQDPRIQLYILNAARDGDIKKFVITSVFLSKKVRILMSIWLIIKEELCYTVQ